MVFLGTITTKFKQSCTQVYAKETKGNFTRNKRVFTNLFCTKSIVQFLLCCQVINNFVSWGFLVMRTPIINKELIIDLHNLTNEHSNNSNQITQFSIGTLNLTNSEVAISL